MWCSLVRGEMYRQLRPRKGRRDTHAAVCMPCMCSSRAMSRRRTWTCALYGGGHDIISDDVSSRAVPELAINRIATNNQGRNLVVSFGTSQKFGSKLPKANHCL
ncbi:hypothetical protein J6590_014535 [Homalodisca vitripennis]|nr:hypothetical protein J6590_014535 [Homalodisca vitripennis]